MRVVDAARRVVVAGRTTSLTVCLAMVLLLGMMAGLATSCTPPEPKASNAVPPPAVAPAVAPIVWASFGADEGSASGPVESFEGRWPQRVLAGLPVTAEMVNLSTSGVSIGEGAAEQLARLDQAGTRPTVATVWFGSNEPEGRSAAFTRSLTSLVDELKKRGATDVVLIGRRTTTGRGPYRYADEVERVAAATGSAFVPVDGLGRNPGEPAAQQAIADAVLAKLTP